MNAKTEDTMGGVQKQTETLHHSESVYERENILLFGGGSSKEVIEPGGGRTRRKAGGRGPPRKEGAV